MTNDQQTIDKLFRDLVKVYSTSATSLIGINSMQSAIEELVCNNDDLSKEISKLSNVIKKTQPRMFPLDNLMLILDKQINSFDNNKELTKTVISKMLNEFKKRLELEMNSLIKFGLDSIDDDDFIVIHSIEENIEHLIPEAKKKGKKFKILVLKQDIITTSQILKILTNHNIEFEVIPEYDLVHYFDEITKLFIGTQALTNDDHLICDPGTSNIVSECHIHDIPIYLFLKTLKFSHYPAAEQNILKNNYQDESGGIEYNFSIHSNDIIKLKLINKIITDKGEIHVEQIPTIREQILSEY